MAKIVAILVYLLISRSIIYIKKFIVNKTTNYWYFVYFVLENGNFVLENYIFLAVGTMY